MTGERGGVVCRQSFAFRVLASGATSRMLSSSEVPKLLQRSHVLFGYRPPNQSCRYYVASAFRLHNELINVWTHLLPVAFIYCFYLHGELFSGAAPRIPLLFLYFGVIFLLLASSLAHLMHSRSICDHIFWFLVDFAGIAVFGLCIGLQRFCSSAQLPAIITYLYLPSLLMISVLQFLSSSCLFVHLPHWPPRLHIRAFSCLLAAIWVYVPLIPRYLSFDSSDASLELHNRAFYWLLISGLFMSGQVPERFFPGKFDFFGYGHQLFHICILMMAWNLCEAAVLDASHTLAEQADHLRFDHLISFLALIAAILVIAFAICKLMKSATSKNY